jgi:ribonuclease BN (tRNA processing enzyme)
MMYAGMRSKLVQLFTVILMGALFGSADAQTRVLMLGTGTPNADPERSGPAVAILVNDRVYLVDSGPGVVRRAMAAEQKGIPGIGITKLTHVFLTHLHSDHTVGLPDLLYTPWVKERTEPLHVFGPSGTKRMMRHIAEAWKEDVHLRTHSLEPTNKTGYRAVATDVREGIVYRDNNVTVSAFRVPHSAWKESYGYIFQTADRRIVISGDCTPSEAIVRACNGCDVLVHDVYSAGKFPTRPPEWQKYHAQAHTSTTELAKIAAQAKPKLLLLYHQLYWGASDEDLVKEVKRGHSGQVQSARDLEVY